jgi:hypothetical protein
MSTQSQRPGRETGKSGPAKGFSHFEERTGSGPQVLDHRLFDVIDSDTIESVFHFAGINWPAEFANLDIDIIVQCDGTADMTHHDG